MRKTSFGSAKHRQSLFFANLLIIQPGKMEHQIETRDFENDLVDEGQTLSQARITRLPYCPMASFNFLASLPKCRV